MKQSSGNIVRGFWLLARGQAQGIEEFGNAIPPFAASLAPLVAFPLVGAILMAMQHEYWIAAMLFCSRLVGVLIQPVTIEFASSRFGGNERWLMTSTALNWSIWMMLPLMFLVILIDGTLSALGLPDPVSAAGSIGALVGYMLWLQWFIVKSGLRIAGWLAALILAAITVAVGAVNALPYLMYPGLLTHLIHLQPLPNHAPQSNLPASAPPRSFNAR